MPPAEESTQKEVQQAQLKEFRAEVNKRQISNAENFDKAIFSLSTAFLGFSIAFLSNIIPYDNSILKVFLPISWGLFSFSIIQTILSYLSANIGMSKQIEIANRYCESQNPSDSKLDNNGAWLTRMFNFGSGVTFILAVVVTIIFFIANSPQIRKTSTPLLQKYLIIQLIQKDPQNKIHEIAIEVPQLPFIITPPPPPPPIKDFKTLQECLEIPPIQKDLQNKIQGVAIEVPQIPFIITPPPPRPPPPPPIKDSK